MSPSRRAAVVAAGVILLAAVGAFALWRALDGGDSADSGGRTGSAAVVSDVADADPPFGALTAGTITVGGQRVEFARSAGRRRP